MDRTRTTLDVLDASSPGEALLDGAAPDAIYAHVPFCVHKCHYCDFYSLVDHRGRMPAFVDRFEDEVRAIASRIDPSRLRTAFVGGGTPTMLEPPQLERVLRAVGSLASGRRLEEFTVEANPETVDVATAEALVRSGVDRVSIGCQSFDPRHRETLERRHDPASVPRAVERLRHAGIERLSLDLIFGVPGSTLEDWERDLEQAIALEPDHLSCYGLVFEDGTPLAERRRLGRIEPIDDAVEAAMYDLARRRIAEAGYDHYEVSNWARPGEECRHNLVYWTLGDWVAVGPAAAGNLGDTRYRNRPRLDDWLESTGASRVVDVERPSPSIACGEWFMLGLRLRAGIPRAAVEARLASDPRRAAIVDDLLGRGDLEWHGSALRIPESRIMTSDGILGRLV